MKPGHLCDTSQETLLLHTSITSLFCPDRNNSLLLHRKKQQLSLSYSIPYNVTEASKDGLPNNLSELERLQLMVDLLYPGVKLED